MNKPYETTTTVNHLPREIVKGDEAFLLSEINKISEKYGENTLIKADVFNMPGATVTLDEARKLVSNSTRGAVALEVYVSTNNVTLNF